ncbi:MAG: hypothetical protein JSR60_07810 [Proteobacteria bacterium]|nr:hypothetical protein [Pseudomonadota bacterium]
MPVDPTILEPILLACLDKKPVDFGRVDEAEVTRARAAIKRAAGAKLASFNQPMTRTNFLCGCLDFTRTQLKEHLIAAYGYRHGKTTLVERLHHISGEQRSVAIPPYVQQEIVRHHSQEVDNEVIVFHNHPRTGHEPGWFYVVKALIQDLPIPSSADRGQLQNYALNPLGLVRQFLKQGQVRFYLGESGYVSEFSLPIVTQLLARMNIRRSSRL